MGAASGDAQGLILALLSGVISGGGVGTVWDARAQIQDSCIQDKCPTNCAFSLAQKQHLQKKEQALKQTQTAKSEQYFPNSVNRFS